MRNRANDRSRTPPVRHQVDERRDLPVALDRVAQRQFGTDLVAVAPSLALAQDVARFLELGHDPLNGPLGHTDRRSHVTHSQLGVLRDAQQHVRVVGQEGPRRRHRHGRFPSGVSSRHHTRPAYHTISRVRKHDIAFVCRMSYVGVQ